MLRPGNEVSDGFAMLVTLLALFVVSLLGAMLLQVGELDVAVSAHYRSNTAALYVAESALEATIDDFRQDWAAGAPNSWFYEWVDFRAFPVAPISPFPDPESTFINGSELIATAVPGVPYPGTPYVLGVDTSLGTGSFSRIVWLPPRISNVGANGSSYKVELQTRSIGVQPGTAAPAEVVLDAVVSIEMRNASPWNNALVLGEGNGGVLLNGQVQVAGPIHAVGGSGGQTFDFAGSSQINSYAGISDATGLGALATKVPALGEMEWEGETVTALDATFRVKDTTFNMGATGSLGEPDATGNTVKETLDAAWSTDEILGDVHADVVGDYDLDPATTFPSLSDPYVDPDTDTAYGSFADWLGAHSYDFPSGDLTIDHDTASFSFSDPLGRGSLSWNQGSQVLTISGIVRVTDIQWGQNATVAQMPAILYRGTGVIYSTGGANIQKSFYPEGHYLEDGPDVGTAVDGSLGLVVAQTARFNDSINAPLQPVIMAAVYAEGRLELHGATNLVGSVVTNHLSVMGGTARIWHVPRLGVMYPRGVTPGQQSLTVFGGRLLDWLQRR